MVKPRARADSGAVAVRLAAQREALLELDARLFVPGELHQEVGAHGGQEVAHLHVHLFGGAPLGPMLASASVCAARL